MKSEELTLPSGETVTVRGLTGLEVALIAKRDAATVDDFDAPAGMAAQIGLAVLGKTKVRDAELAGAAWLASHSGVDYAAVTRRIGALSGFGRTATPDE